MFYFKVHPACQHVCLCVCRESFPSSQVEQETIPSLKSNGGGFHCTVSALKAGGRRAFSGDGGELFEQDVLTQCVERNILPHIQTDGANLHGHIRQTDLLPAQL